MTRGTLRRVETAATVAVAVLALVLAGAAVTTAAGADGAERGATPPCLGPNAATEVGEFVGDSADALPSVARDAMVGERIAVKFDSRTYGVVVSERGRVTSVTAGGIDDPTLVARTDCETIRAIRNAEDGGDAMARAISRGDITWEGIGGAKNVRVAFGTEAVQIYSIVSASDGGDGADALDGFQSGVGETLSWPAEAAGDLFG